MNSPWKPTLAGKLSLASALLILLLTAAMAVDLVVRHFDQESEEFVGLGLGMVQTVSEQAEVGAFSGDARELERVARNAVAFPSVVSAWLVDPRGLVLAHHGAGPPVPSPERLRALVDNGGPIMLGEPLTLLQRTTHVDFAAPILEAAGPSMPGESAGAVGRPLGHVLLSLSAQPLQQRMRDFLVSSVKLLLLLAAIGAAGLAVVATRALRPLRAVTRAAREVAAGDLGQQVEVRGADEAGQLAAAFNQMTARLREAREQLEQRVSERTRSLEEATAEAYRLAKHDVLTGLPNRTLLRERLEQARDAALRQRTAMAVCFVDVDHFKSVNDSLGHENGDEVLKVIAARLARLIGGRGFAARLGGDEFVVVREGLPLERAQGAVAELARGLIDAVSEPIALSGREVRLGASVGLALYPGDGDDATQLLRAADTAMYVAKGQGRMGFRFFAPEMDASVKQRLHIETDLRRALAQDQLQVWYQPQYRFDGQLQHLTGAEALLRWQHPERGWVPPGEFIPIAEDSGLIRDVGAFVLERAIGDAKAWRQRTGQALRVAVNVSPQQLNRAGLAEAVASALRRHALPPECLELELTESGIVQDPARGLQVLSDLKALGVQLAIDDFGTGYSSLSHLTRLPVQVLKIDRSFVAGLPGSRSDVAVVETICAMARKLNLEVLAEGVETHEQLQALRRNGCHSAQGYLFARPMPNDEFCERFLPAAVEARAEVSGASRSEAVAAGV